MRIVIINTVPYGSTGKISKNIGIKAEEIGDEVYYVYGWTKKKRRSNCKYEIIATSLISKALHGILSNIWGLDGLFSSLSTIKLIKKLKKIQPDLLHLHILHDYFLNIKLLYKYIEESGIKVIWTFHDCWSMTGGCMYFSMSQCMGWKNGCKDCEHKKYLMKLFLNSPRLMWQIKRKGLSFIKDLTITVPSNWLKQIVNKSIYHNQTVKVIHNGIDLKVFKPCHSDFRIKHNLENNYIVLGVAFDWGIRKGLDVFIELASLLPTEYQIVLVGVTAKQKSIIPNNILTIPKTSDMNELIEIYSSSDVFVNPTREEVFGMVNIEALACGIPVIMFDTDGAPESINESCGIVVKEKNAKALSQEIMRVCREKPFKKEFCIEKAKEFDESKCYAKYVELYHNI